MGVEREVALGGLVTTVTIVTLGGARGVVIVLVRFLRVRVTEKVPVLVVLPDNRMSFWLHRERYM